MWWPSPGQGELLRKGTQTHKGRVRSLGFCVCVCRLQIQNMLKHGKKGICLSDSDMFQHFPTGSCTAQNNYRPGARPLAYDYICIMLQNSGQSGHTHMGVAGMRSPERRPCCTAGRSGDSPGPSPSPRGAWAAPTSHGGGGKGPGIGHQLAQPSTACPLILTFVSG